MTRDVALNAYHRVREWEKAASGRLYRTIVLPYFSGNLCRMHNCRVNFERGYAEWPVRGKSHAELAKLAKRYDYEQRAIWDASSRLSDHFARYF